MDLFRENNSRRLLQQHPRHPRSLPMASSRAETIVISSSGDLLTCRCRHSPYPNDTKVSSSSLKPQQQQRLRSNTNSNSNNAPFRWTDELCCSSTVSTPINHDDEDNVSVHPGGGFCSLWPINNNSQGCSSDAAAVGDKNNFRTSSASDLTVPTDRGGLLGGSPADVASPLVHHQQQSINSFYNTHNIHGLRGGSDPSLIDSRSNSNDTNNNVTSNGGAVVVTPFSSIANQTHQPRQSPRGFPVSPSNSVARKGTQNAFRHYSPMGTPTTSTDLDEDRNMVPIMSFDYSQTTDGDMLTSTTSASFSKRNNTAAAPSGCPTFLHGIPTFCASFDTVKVRHVSAHPLGAHVLVICQAGLLYSYGLNSHGQLGIGVLSDTRGPQQGFVMTPTIVTPLLENGGKAVHCAAGVDHSLVVVEMEERRLMKSRSMEPSHPANNTAAIPSSQHLHRSESQSNTFPQSRVCSNHGEEHAMEAVLHHQMYGFGRNNFMKIGLVRPNPSKRQTPSTTRSSGRGPPLNHALPPALVDRTECESLPRRVALRCSVRKYPRSRIDFADPSSCLGIFAVAASVDHSAALVRRTSGDVELFTWGNASFGALGLPHFAHTDRQEDIDSQAMQAPTLTPVASPQRIVPVPTFVACLSRTSNRDAQIASLLNYEKGEFPVDVSLGRSCSFIVTSIGRCFAFGTSETGMLGLGLGVTEANQPVEVFLPRDSLLDQLSTIDKFCSVHAGSSHAIACTTNGNAYGWGTRCYAGLESKPHIVTPTSSDHHTPRHVSGSTPRSVSHTLDIEWSPKNVEFPADSPIIRQACAGNDCSIFLSASGQVWSTGKNSGRLGCGELSMDVIAPKPLFGGLQLFKQQPLDG